MAEVNNGLVVDTVRILVLDEARGVHGVDALWNLALAAAELENQGAVLRVDDLVSGDVLARGRFRSRHAAERARSRLVGLVDGDGAASIDWPSEVARLSGPPTRP